MLSGYRKPSQFELFPHSNIETAQGHDSKRILKDLTLSPENIIVVCIVFVMVMILAYSLGIERGRRFVEPSLPDRKELKQGGVLSKGLVGVEQKLAPQGVTPKIQREVKETPVKLTPVKTLESPKTFETNYTIQVASFKSQKYAREEAKNLEKSGYEIFVLSKGDYSIVCVGKFFERNEAQKILNKFKNRYKDCMVRRL